MYLQINTVKYAGDQEIMNIYENLQIVWSQFFTDMLLFIYIRSTSNIYWFGIQILCQWIQTNSYLVTFDYSQYLVQHSMNNPKVKKTTIRHYLFLTLLFKFNSLPGRDIYFYSLYHCARTILFFFKSLCNVANFA